MEFLNQILNCQSDEQVNTIISEKINYMNNSNQGIEQLGFINYGNDISCYCGFIPLNTKIHYASMNMETYGMQTTDFFYDFAHFVRKYGIDSKASMIYNMEYFINEYFGLPGKNDRETIFNDNAFNSTTTDEEYFRALENNKIGDLKGKGAALCTERSALAQQLLSLFDIETYYCMGCADLGYNQEAHCFNVIKRKHDYALLDYSIPITAYKKDGSIRTYYPFIGKLTNEKFIDFISNGTLKYFEDYQFVEQEKQILDVPRQYIVGSYSIEKEKNL